MNAIALAALLAIGIFMLINQRKIMATMDDLVTKVTEVKGEVASMKTFVAGLEQQIKDALAGTTLPTAVQAKVDAVFADASAVAQDIKDAIDSNPDTPVTGGGPAATRF